MATLFRRFLLVVALLFWQGGFVFYGAVVVPVGADVLGSHSAQGWVTRSVTNYLNVAGLVAVLAWGWDLLASRPRLLLWALWGGLLATLALQFWLHVRLDALLDDASRQVLDRALFRRFHSAYLIASTAQWLDAMALLFATLRAWRRADAASFA